MTTPEYRTMVSCTVILTDTLALNIKHIGGVFFQEGIIPCGVYDFIISNIREPKDKSRELVSALTNKVKSSSTCFKKIVILLMKEGKWIEKLITELKTKYEEYGGKNFPQPENPAPVDVFRQPCERAGNGEGPPKHDRQIKQIKPSHHFKCNLPVAVAVAVVIISVFGYGYWEYGRPHAMNNVHDNSASTQEDCHPIEDTDRKLLHQILGKVGDSEILCIYLNVSEGVWKSKSGSQQIRDCVNAYIDNNPEACFEDILAELCDMQLRRLASELAEKKNMDYKSVQRCKHS